MNWHFEGWVMKCGPPLPQSEDITFLTLLYQASGVGSLEKYCEYAQSTECATNPHKEFKMRKTTLQYCAENA